MARRCRDAVPLTPEQRALVESPEAAEVVGFYAGRYAQHCPWLADDIRSAAWLGVIAAAQRYEPARGKFKNFCQPRVCGAVRDLLRNELPKGFRRGLVRGVQVVPFSRLQGSESFRDTSFDGYGNSDADVSERVAVSDELPVGWEEESVDAVRWLCRGLTAGERRVMVAYFTTPKGMRGIGRGEGLCESRVSQVISQALRFIREREGVVV